MIKMNEKLRLSLISGMFLFFYFVPFESFNLYGPIRESFTMAGWYAREHVMKCLVPAFFIAGAISVFIKQGSVLRYLGSDTKKIISYSVASVSGSVLAVCSCTILPIFAGIYAVGAGIGPAAAFLFAGPAINILSVILTWKILGLKLGLARALTAVFLSIFIGIVMSLIFRNREQSSVQAHIPVDKDDLPVSKSILFFAVMSGLLIFSTWGAPSDSSGIWQAIYVNKWILTSILWFCLAAILAVWFGTDSSKTVFITAIPVIIGYFTDINLDAVYAAGAVGLAWILYNSGEKNRLWLTSTWDLAKKMVPLLFAGVLVSGFLLGRPGEAGLIPTAWISSAVGGNSIGSNLAASVAGALMYIATLTEVPIIEALLGSGMGYGPALTLLLAGPALSLPNMLVIRSILGTVKTTVFVSLVIVFAAFSGIIFGIVNI